MRDNGKGLGLGIFLLTLGILWLLSMAKIVTISTLYALITLWPLILVAIGIGILFRNKWAVRTVTWLVLLAVIVGYGYFAAPLNGPVIIHTQSANTNVTLDKLPNIEKGELKLDLGATKLFVDSQTANLLDASIDQELVSHRETTKEDDRTADIYFKMKGINLVNLKFTNKMRNDFHLNKDVIWTLSLDTGAIEGNLDLSGLKVEKLDIDTGASMLKVAMGSYDTVLNLDAGASSIDITLPADTGIRVRMDGALNNTNLDNAGWEKKGNLHYSPDYDSKAKKIEAYINMGVGKLTIENR